MQSLTTILGTLVVIVVSALLCGFVTKRILSSIHTMQDTISHLSTELAKANDDNWHLSKANENYSRMLCNEYRRSSDHPTSKYGPRIVHVKRSRLLSDVASDILFEGIMEDGPLF